MGEYVHADMSTLRAQYNDRKKFQALSERIVKVDQKLLRERKMRLVEERAAASYRQVNYRLQMINEGQPDKQEIKAIAKSVKRLEAIVNKLGGESGQLPNISKMINSIVSELNQYSGEGWWSKLMGAMGKSPSNPVTKAAALEGLLKGGMEYVEDLLSQQGEKLTDEPLSDQSQIGQNVIKSLAQAFDPGRISSLSALGGGKISQLFGTKGSLGGVIAQDLANLKPSQLRAFAQELKSMGTSIPPQDATPQAAQAAAAQDPQGQAPAEAKPTDQQPGVSGAAKDDVQLATPDSESGQRAATPSEPPASGERPTVAIDTKTIQSKAGLYLGNMKKRLDQNDPKTALLHAANALKSLGFQSVDDARSALSVTKAAPAQQPAKTGT